MNLSKAQKTSKKKVSEANKMAKAVVIVDMLNDFVLEDGKLPVPGAQGLVETIGKVRGAAGERDVLVVYAREAHAKNDPEFKVWGEHGVKGTYGAQVVDELAPREGDLVIEKQELSMFTNPEADNWLRQRGVDELYIAGVATEYCVRGAALDALAKGYRVNLIVDAIEGVDLQKGDKYRALVEMGNAGARPVTAAAALEEILG